MSYVSVSGSGQHSDRRRTVRPPQIASRDDDFIKFDRFRTVRIGAGRGIDQNEDGRSAAAVCQTRLAEQGAQRGLGRVIAADARRPSAGDQGAGIKDLQTTLTCEEVQAAFKGARRDVEPPHGVGRLRDHRGGGAQHQCCQRG